MKKVEQSATTKSHSKVFPSYEGMERLLIDTLYHLSYCDSHSDFDAEMQRFINKVDSLEWSEYREECI